LNNKKEYPNIIFLTVDCLRFDHLSFTGYPVRTSPNIDRICKHSTICIPATSPAPYTKASFKSIMTGLLPFTRGGYHTIKGLTTLTTILRKHGFFTIGVPNHPIFLADGYRENFNYFLAPRFSPEKSIVKEHVKSKIIYLPPKIQMSVYSFNLLFEYLKRRGPPYAQADQITKTIIALIGKLRGKNPLFIWAHFMDTHYPYFPPDDIFYEIFGERKSRLLSVMTWGEILKKIIYDEEMRRNITYYAQRLYDSSIRFVDHNIGVLMDYLERNGFIDETILVITADHGEEFLEHGAFGHTGRRFFTHMYEELLRVPLIVLVPPDWRPEIKMQGQPAISLVDIFPTILELLGVNEKISCDGKPLHELLKASNNGRLIFAEASLYNKERGTLVIPPDERVTIAIKFGEWKYIFYETYNRKDELYNLRLDPAEQTNLIDEKRTLAEFIRSTIIYPRLRYIKRQLLRKTISSLKRKFARTVCSRSF